MTSYGKCVQINERRANRDGTGTKEKPLRIGKVGLFRFELVRIRDADKETGIIEISVEKNLIKDEMRQLYEYIN